MQFKFILKKWVKPVWCLIALYFIAMAGDVLYGRLSGQGKVDFFTVISLIAAVVVSLVVFLVSRKDSFYCEIKGENLLIKIGLTTIQNKISNFIYIKPTHKGFVFFKSHRIIILGNKINFPIYPEDGDKFIEELLKINPDIKII